MEQNIENAVGTAKPSNKFEAEIADLKRDRDSFIKHLNRQIEEINNESHDLRVRIQENVAKVHDLNMKKESVYKRYRTAIMNLKDNSHDYYSEGRNLVGVMLNRFFDKHPEIHEIWNAEKDSLWHQVQEGGVQ